MVIYQDRKIVCLKIQSITNTKTCNKTIAYGKRYSTERKSKLATWTSDENNPTSENKRYISNKARSKMGIFFFILTTNLMTGFQKFPEYLEYKLDYLKTW